MTQALANIDAELHYKANVNTISDATILNAGNAMERSELPIWKAVQAQKCWYSASVFRTYTETQDTKKFDAQEKAFVRKNAAKDVIYIGDISLISSMKTAKSHLFRNQLIGIETTYASNVEATYTTDTYDIETTYTYENSVGKYDIYTENSNNADMKIAVIREASDTIRRGNDALHGCYYKVAGQRRFHTILGVEKDVLILQHAGCPAFFTGYLKKYERTWDE